jgi:hypothetical protein
MPYIKQERRHGWTPPENVGELNYALSQEIKSYLTRKGQSYGTFNDVVGVLECLKLEIYRRLVAPYEDTKIIENGDVF